MDSSWCRVSSIHSTIHTNCRHLVTNSSTADGASTSLHCHAQLLSAQATKQASERSEARQQSSKPAEYGESKTIRNWHSQILICSICRRLDVCNVPMQPVMRGPRPRIVPSHKFSTALDQRLPLQRTRLGPRENIWDTAKWSA